MKICVDIDGVLASWDNGWRGVRFFGDVIDGAKYFLEELHKRDCEIIIYSCRGLEELNAPYKAPMLRNFIRDWLEANDLPYDDIFVGQGKPIANYYVDDKGITCRPEDDPAAFNMALEQMFKD